MAKVVAGQGPQSGPYTLAWRAKSKPTVWHLRQAGQTICGAHNGAGTAIRTNAVYVAKARFPRGAAVCSTCAAAATGLGKPTVAVA